MRLFKVYNPGSHYDAYRSMLVCASCEEEARRIHPDGRHIWMDGVGWADKDNGKPSEEALDDWTTPERVAVREMPTFLSPGTVLHTDWHDS